MTRRREPPIFLVGTGRCGSTIVGSVLGMHPALAWVSSWLDAWPSAPILSAGSRLWELPGTDRFRDTRFVPKPVEPNRTFRHHDPTFDQERLDGEILESGRVHLVPLIERICRAQGKPRFMGKMVGRPVKIDLFEALYDDAIFIHVVRDLKPTLASLLRVDFYDWGPLSTWRWDVIPPDYLEYYERCGRPEALSAAIGLELNRAAIRRQLAAIPQDRQMDLPYAEFTRDPIGMLERVGRLTGLEIDDRYRARVASRRIHGDSDRKWETYFDADTVRQLDELEERFGE